ncbi:MAG: alpha-glucuronidase family glycosyl hydrolase, partial [Tepidisphaeraceae bacterium]
MSFRWYWTFASLVWVIALVQPTAACAETGYDAWLRYPQLSGTSLQQARGLITQIVLDNDADPILKSAADELARGCSGLLGTKIRITGRATQSGAVVLRTKPAGNGNAEAPDGFSLKSVQVDGHDGIAIVGETTRGTLYGAFALLRILQTDQSIQNLNVTEAPAFAMRMANQWDNPNGTIERGYGGASL